MDNELLREDQDGWSRPATPKPTHIAVIFPNDDIRALWVKWMKEAREAPPPDTWAWWNEAQQEECYCAYCNEFSEDATLDGCREKPKKYHNPTDYGFKGWELE
jgi:hypothetical protein